ncbi:protoporphyrinogen/coproporphyrinogen oxidase [Streptomyces virginiae]|uniref:protoporphyrinogen/coproporphyrinogen oxidase n=1 Tax=Streptomyces virginiae TaxID=1961 RepID=UPI00224DDB66|nr:FAD-dependent oxidoreductase [Streptomyces virginiae]MCX5274609.1 FAD-dependent oxidoreductase [Streptomyces virginiae]
MTNEVAIIGGGISGLVAAYRLSASHGIMADVFESESDVGGRASTVMLDGRPLNTGAQFIADFYTETLDLVSQLDLDQAVTQRSQTAYIVRDKTPEPLWPVAALLKSPALSWRAKLRLLGVLPNLVRTWRDLDVHNLARSIRYDRKTVSEAIKESCGQEDVDYFFGPLLRALLYWDAETTSMTVANAALKAFLTNERTLQFPEGIQGLATRLAQQTNILPQAQVVKVTRQSDGFLLAIADGRVAGPYAAIVLAVPAPLALPIFDELDAFPFLKSVHYSSSVHLALDVDGRDPDYPKGATLFPLSARPEIASFNPTYGPVSQDRRLISIFLSDAGYRELAELSDEDLTLRTMEILTGQTRKISWADSAKRAYCQRWEHALPRFNVGYVAHLEQFKRDFKLPGVALAGDYLSAPYVEGAVSSGNAAAARVAHELQNRAH